ncbi:MAG: pyridoxal phosphate-dependent aminotransferase, partial [Gammaproteobacteria bacterium]|nr:pyridoxal phosphate-dependent aminotransferase [Gammaproteobacteria bacterium]
RLEVIADTYLSVNTPVQNALHKWFDLRPAIHKEIISRIRNNRKFLLEAGLEQKNCECLQAEGGWYAVIKLPGHCQEEDFVLSLLEQKYTFVHPGYFFDFEEEPFIVLSLLSEEKIFQTGVKHVIGQVDSL